MSQREVHLELAVVVGVTVGGTRSHSTAELQDGGGSGPGREDQHEEDGHEDGLGGGRSPSHLIFSQFLISGMRDISVGGQAEPSRAGG